MRKAGIVLIGVSLFLVWRTGHATPVICTLLIAQAYLIGWTAKRSPT